MKIRIVVVMAVGVLLMGCAGPNLPKGAKMVGGGLQVDWTSPAKGTVILAESASGKMVKTESVDEGDTFEFDPTLMDNVEMLNSLFGGSCAEDASALAPLPKNARFVLYFMPDEDSEP